MTKVRVPASTMLFGEFAVLEGHAGIVAAVDKHIELELSSRNDSKVNIDSVLGKYACEMQDMEIESPFEYVLLACKLYQQNFKNGFNLKISSNFSHMVGLGSSAAVCVATCAALRAYFGFEFDREAIFFDAKKAMRAVQKIGSAADVAASAFGGALLYCEAPFSVKKLACDLNITLAYCGYKLKTVEVLRRVNEKYTGKQASLNAIYKELADCVNEVKNKLFCDNAVAINASCLKHQKCMHELGVTTPELNALIEAYRSMPEVIAAKISGSGMGDCIIAFGEFDKKFFSQRKENIAIEIIKKGVELL